jgi:hypothetical protein
VQYTAAVTATHNYLLRRMVRGESGAAVADLRTELAMIPRGRRASAEPDELVLAVFPRDMPPRKVADLLTARLGNL